MKKKKPHAACFLQFVILQRRRNEEVEEEEEEEEEVTAGDWSLYAPLRYFVRERFEKSAEGTARMRACARNCVSVCVCA